LKSKSGGIEIHRSFFCRSPTAERTPSPFIAPRLLPRPRLLPVCCPSREAQQLTTGATAIARSDKLRLRDTAPSNAVAGTAEDW
jgi:hypothetical protein